MFEYNELEEMLKNASLNFNTRPVEKFENYSPSEMANILNHSFENDGIINFRNDIAEKNFQNIPFLNSIKYFLNMINNHGEIKLTSIGNIPPVHVKSQYEQHFILEDAIESGVTKLVKETDSETVHLTKVISYVSKLVKTKNNNISLTKLGKAILDDDFELLKSIFIGFYQNYNLAYMDTFPEFDFSQVFPFFILLLEKYGDKEREINFYYLKMIKAFPALHVPSDLDDYPDHSSTDFNKDCETTFRLRLIERFLVYFNFIKYNKKKLTIEKSELFDEVFLVIPNSSIFKEHSEIVI
ncbi:MAG: hypothetical protein KBF12_12365 [Sebaldella sp.]|nr:hypothetical protein [Sebaldella sp.]